MTASLRPIAGPFVAAAPAGARVRTRLRVSAQDEAVLQAVGRHLGSLAGRDLAARCVQGRLDTKGRAVSRAVRKRALTAESSSRWAGTITRTSEDQYQRAEQNLHAERATLTARIRLIEARLTVPVRGKAGRARGYATPAERHAKMISLKTLKARLSRVQRRLDDWLEINLPAPLTHLANQPRGRYRLSTPVGFPYRGEEVAAQAATAAIRYDISHDTARDRWYIDASWKTPPAPGLSLDELRRRPVVAIDVNHGHLAVGVVAADGNVLGGQATVGLDLVGLPTATRDGRLRAAISGIIATARQYGAQAIVIEDLDFAEARAEGRERHGNRPSRGKRGRGFRRAVSSIPAARFRDRLTQMATNAGLSVIVIDPAYTSRWAAEHWLGSLREHHPNATGHHAAALVIGRRGLGHRARRRVTGNQPAPAEAARLAQTRPRTKPSDQLAPRKPAFPRDPRQPSGTKTGRPHRSTAGDQAAHDRLGPPAQQYSLLLSD
jgi:IS605 OrfB family transposase